MSASKQHYGARAERPRDLPRCPLCRGHWCQGYGDGTVLCKNVASDRAKANRDGVVFYVHRGDGAPARVLPPQMPAAPRAAVEVLDVAHRTALARLPLLDAHRAALRARGLDDVTVRRNGYRSLGVTGRAALARAIAERIGDDAATGVPGVHWREEGGCRWLTFGGAAGLLVPARDVGGRIVALKVRADDPGDGPRYTYISASKHGGPSAVHAVHVPTFADDRTEVRVTEGELKADVCTVLTGVLTISVPGVGSWRAALPMLRELGARTVRVAFDADYHIKPDVARARRDLFHALERAGFATILENWDPALGKGLDDALVQLRATEAT